MRRRLCSFFLITGLVFLLVTATCGCFPQSQTTSVKPTYTAEYVIYVVQTYHLPTIVQNNPGITNVLPLEGWEAELLDPETNTWEVWGKVALVRDGDKPEVYAGKWRYTEESISVISFEKEG